MFNGIKTLFYKNTVKKYFCFLFLLLLFFLVNINKVEAGNNYASGTLDDINIQGKIFQGFPLMVNIDKIGGVVVTEEQKNHFLSNLQDNDYLLMKDKNLNAYALISKNNLVPKTEIELSGNADLLMDTPIFQPYFKNFENGRTIDIVDKYRRDSSSAIFKFLLDGSKEYIEGNGEFWLLYNSIGVEGDNKFLPRKVMVNINNVDGKKIGTQIIDVFENGKVKVELDPTENLTGATIDKTNFYVLGQTHEKDFWYFNGPIIKDIDCPEKITSSRDCNIIIGPQDNGEIILKIRNKYNGNIYQTTKFQISKSEEEQIIKPFPITLELGYVDGDYEIFAESYKNGLLGQEYSKDISIDRLKPSFEDLFPVVLVPENEHGIFKTTLKVSERLKPQYEDGLTLLGGGADIRSIEVDEKNPLIYHITLNANFDSLKVLRFKLKDSGNNTAIGYLYLKRYTDNGNLGVSNIESVQNGFNVDFSTFVDKTTLFENNFGNTGNGLDTIGIGGIETFNNKEIDIQKTILLGYRNQIKKIFPSESLYRDYDPSTKILSISYSGNNDYFVTTTDGKVFRGGLKIMEDKGNNLRYYNLYKNENVITYSDLGLLLNGKILEYSGNEFSKDFKNIEIIHLETNTTNEFVLVGYDDTDNTAKLKFYLINVEDRSYRLLNTMDTKITKKFDSVDMTFYQNKLILIGTEKGEGAEIGIFPVPLVNIKNTQGNSIDYLIGNEVLFNEVIYKSLEVGAFVKGKYLPTAQDCGSNSLKVINKKLFRYDSIDYCNTKELEINEDDKNQIFYDKSHDNYINKIPATLTIKKMGLNSEIPNQKILQVENQPKKYYLGVIEGKYLFTTPEQENKEYLNGGESFEYIKYNKKNIKLVPGILQYSKDEDLYVFKNNEKGATLNDKEGEFYPVVLYDTLYDTSELKVFGVETVSTQIKDKDTGAFVTVEKIVNKKPWKIDTIYPIIYDIKSDNIAPNKDDILNIYFKSQEDVELLELFLGEEDILGSNYNIEKTFSNGVYNFKIKSVVAKLEHFKNNGKIFFKVKVKDKAGNITEKEHEIGPLKGSINTKSLAVKDIKNAGTTVRIQDVLTTTGNDLLISKNNLQVLTGKRIITDNIEVNLPRLDDGTINYDKLFPGFNIINVIEKVNTSTMHLFAKTYKRSGVEQSCYIDANVKMHGYCGFLRGNVYNIVGDLEIDNTLYYKGYSTIFVHGDVTIGADIYKELESQKQENLLGIIATGNIYIKGNVKTVQSLLTSEGTVYVQKD